MTDKEIHVFRWFGASIVIILVLNMLMVHRREDSVNEFRAYVQGAVSCVSPNSVRIPTPPPITQTFYEN